jgi:hypothetical protein
MWLPYLAVILSAGLIYFLAVARRRIRSSSPQQKNVETIAIVGELAAVLAAVTAVYVAFHVERSSCQFGKRNPLNVRYNGQFKDIKRVHEIHCADTATASASLQALQRDSPKSAATAYAQQAFEILHG